LGIVNDILDLSKIEARQMSLELTDGNLLDLARKAVAVVQKSADQKRLLLKLTFASTMPLSVKVDPLRVRQVLVNLLSNAIKFTEQGEVELIFAYETLGKGRGRFRLAVRDTGIGIAEAQRPLLFKSFGQVDNSTTRRFGGTGLGLVLSRSLVEKMGGKLDFESMPGKGSTFWFEVDLDHTDAFDEVPAIAPVNTHPPSAHPPVGCKVRPTVLVVEDVQVNRVLMKALLHKLFPDIRILEACNGQESIALIEAEPVDVVLMDIHMPIMDGIEATRLIRKMTPPTKNLPVVAITASALEDERDRCFECGMNDFLTKPIRLEMLQKALGQYLM
jgi:CheY-like chemotaxis protein